MPFSRRKPYPLSFSLVHFTLTIVYLSTQTVSLAAENIPLGFFSAPGGRIIANNPRTAVAPPGYHLKRSGNLIELVPNNDNHIDSSTPPLVQDNPPRQKTEKPRNAEISRRTLGTHSGRTLNNRFRKRSVKKFDLAIDYRDEFLIDLLDQSQKVTASQILDANGPYKFTMAPINMRRQLATFTMTYRVNPNLKIMGKGQYVKNTMPMLDLNGAESTLTSQGTSDTLLSAQLMGPFHLAFYVGLSLPTGNINAQGTTTILTNSDPVQANLKYPYGMQLGTGSYDFIHGLGFQSSNGRFDWGSQYKYTSRMNKNNNGYKWGNQLIADTWLRLNLTHAISSTIKMTLRSLGQIEGVDKDLIVFSQFSPTLEASSYGGKRLDVALGSEFSFSQLHLSVDFAIPVYQNLWGPQLATKRLVSLNIRKIF